MPIKKSKSATRRTKIKDLPKREEKLIKDEQKKVKGGYIEQDNLYKAKKLADVTDGMSNTLIGPSSK